MYLVSQKLLTYTLFMQHLGALVVLDSRIVTKPYGKIFTKSLDSDFITIENQNELHDKKDQLLIVQHLSFGKDW